MHVAEHPCLCLARYHAPLALWAAALALVVVVPALVPV
jgi:hypothetical protein